MYGTYNEFGPHIFLYLLAILAKWHKIARYGQANRANPSNADQLLVTMANGPVVHIAAWPGEHRIWTLDEAISLMKMQY
jgi:hypothetical protein